MRSLPLLLAHAAVLAACGRTPLDLDETPPPTDAGADADGAVDASDETVTERGVPICVVPAACQPLSLESCALPEYAFVCAGGGLEPPFPGCHWVTPEPNVLAWCCPCGGQDAGAGDADAETCSPPADCTLGPPFPCGPDELSVECFGAGAPSSCRFRSSGEDIGYYCCTCGM